MLYYLQSHWSYTGHGLHLIFSAASQLIRPNQSLIQSPPSSGMVREGCFLVWVAKGRVLNGVSSEAPSSRHF
jgi:hypothetical protein